MKVVLFKDPASCLVQLQETRDEVTKTIGVFLKADVEATRSSGSSSSSASAAHHGKRNRDEGFHTEVKNKVLSEVLLGASYFIVFLRLSKTEDGRKTLDATVQPPRTSLRTDVPTWRLKMCDYPPAKLSICIKIASDDEDGEPRDFASMEGMDITQLFNGDGWVCRSSIPKDIDSLPADSVMHLKIVAEVPVNALLEDDDDDFPPRKKIAIAEEGDEAVTIIARNGTEVKANKSLLCDCSPVLEAMFRSGMRESVTGRLYMSDGSDEGAKAFIQYTFSGDLTMAKEDMKIAFEMLCLGHMYGILSLEVRAMEYLLERRNEGFSVGLAFEVYMFLRNVEFGVGLKEKVTGILKGKANELKALPEYQQIFKENPNSNVATELQREFCNPDSSE